ncbi:MAG: hypothetical protein IJU03_10305 [Thermoguttaceae bacterium]|nr:hypothetical protein [Thermoguttaceae bacterium]
MKPTETERIADILDILWNHEWEDLSDFFESSENSEDLQRLKELGVFNDLEMDGVGTREGETVSALIKYYLEG